MLAVSFAADDWPCDPRPFYPEAQWEVEFLRKGSSVAQVERRIREGFDLYFNLCDGAADQDIPGIEVVRTLRRTASRSPGPRRNTTSRRAKT
jgi:hypothetical protein